MNDYIMCRIRSEVKSNEIDPKEFAHLCTYADRVKTDHYSYSSLIFGDLRAHSKVTTDNSKNANTTTLPCSENHRVTDDGLQQTCDTARQHKKYEAPQ